MKRPKNVVQPAPNPNQLSFSLREAASVTGLALWALRSAIWAGQLPARLVGKRQIVLRADLEKWLASQPVIRRRAA